MDWRDWRSHFRTTGAALKNWFIAQCQDSLAVALLWLIGLLIIGIPWAPVWAILAGVLQFIPNFGIVISVIPPALIGAFSSNPMRFVYVLILFAVIMVIDGFFLQPYLMKRTAKVPFWAALGAPLVLGFLIPFWGVLLAPPLLAIIYAFRHKALENKTRAAQARLESPESRSLRDESDRTPLS
jgi:predicted PurR-regulated permease PerM